MKIGYFGDGPWAHLALDRIRAEPAIEVSFIVARDDTRDPVLAAAANEMDVPFLTHPNVNSDEFITEASRFGADLYASMSFNQILRRPILDATPGGFINCHAGALPFYRGRNPLNWALINGEDRIGVTVHHVDDGIDTGDIIVQRFADVGPDDSYADILDRAFPLCAEVMLEALQALAAGRATRQPQSAIHPVGFYCGRRSDGDEWIDWTWSSERIHNFVRAITSPAPGARTVRRRDPLVEHLAILKTCRIPGAPNYLATCGEIVGRDAEGAIVKTGDGTLRIVSAAAIGSAGEFTQATPQRWFIGSRLSGI